MIAPITASEVTLKDMDNYDRYLTTGTKITFSLDLHNWLHQELSKWQLSMPTAKKTACIIPRILFIAWINFNPSLDK